MHSEKTSQGLPKFVPDTSNVAHSFNNWLCELKIELASVAAKAGKTAGENPVDVYTDHLKLLSLLSAIGTVGVTALEATGYYLNGESNTYNDALRCRRRLYDRKETRFVSLQRFTTAKQNVDEDGLNYLLRIEQYSRSEYRSKLNANIALPDGPSVIR